LNSMGLLGLGLLRESVGAAAHGVAEVARSRHDKARRCSRILYKARVLVSRVTGHSQVLLRDRADIDTLAVGGHLDFDGVLGADLKARVFHYLSIAAELTDDRAVVLVDKDDLAVAALLVASVVLAAWSVIVGVVLGVCRVAALLAAPARQRRLRALHESGALGEDCLKGIQIFLADIVADRRELDACESARVGS